MVPVFHFALVQYYLGATTPGGRTCLDFLTILLESCQRHPRQRELSIAAPGADPTDRARDNQVERRELVKNDLLRSQGLGRECQLSICRSRFLVMARIALAHGPHFAVAHYPKLDAFCALLEPRTCMRRRKCTALSVGWLQLLPFCLVAIAPWLPLRRVKFISAHLETSLRY